jgi:hypothetical protein
MRPLLQCRSSLFGTFERSTDVRYTAAFGGNAGFAPAVGDALVEGTGINAGDGFAPAIGDAVAIGTAIKSVVGVASGEGTQQSFAYGLIPSPISVRRILHVLPETRRVSAQQSELRVVHVLPETRRVTVRRLRTD